MPLSVFSFVQFVLFVVVSNGRYQNTLKNGTTNPTNSTNGEVHNYLKATGYRLGLLVNFGQYPKLKYEDRSLMPHSVFLFVLFVLFVVVSNG
jgi:hypothetical protein